MNKDIITKLHTYGIALEAGLTAEELTKIEAFYQITFPKELRDLLMQAVPVGASFYNWRDFSEENVAHIKHMLNIQFEWISEEAETMGWCWDKEWGERPNNDTQIAKAIRERLREAPRIIPIYGHRYIPMVEGENIPIFSIYGSDIIYYGENLEDYFDVEFGDKDQRDIDFESLRYIPFWTSITS